MMMHWSRLSFLLAALLLAGPLFSQDQPEWEVSFEESEVVGFQSATWHAKDFGWLLTFRLTTPSQIKLRPISHVRFEGYNAQDEQVWSDSKTIRRKDMDSSLNGSDQLFVRMLLKDVPDEVATLKIRFDNGDGGDKSS